MSQDRTRVTTVRLPAHLADEVDFVARVDGLAASEFMREAIAAHIAARRSDPEFRERLRERMDADQEILDRLMLPRGAVAAARTGREPQC